MYFRILGDVDRAAQTYLLADLDEREAVLIDPSDSQAELISVARWTSPARLTPRIARVFYTVTTAEPISLFSERWQNYAPST